MEAQKIQFAAGLKVICFSDAYGRETEICVGHRDIMVTNKSFEGSAESMRRYSREDVELLIASLKEMI